tara:strand:- start:885 stop:1100 length:216 start_codon:yes stop_codon:yes gene_type:complete
MFKPEEVFKAEVPAFLAFDVRTAAFSNVAPVLTVGVISPIGDAGGAGGGAGLTSGTFGDDKHMLFIFRPFF